MPTEAELLTVIEGLRDRVYELEETIKTLTMADLEEPRRPIHLTPTEGIVVVMFLRHCDKVLTKEQIMAYLYSARPYADQPHDIRIIDVIICNIRRKFRLLDVTIGTVWGRGYCIDKENHARLHALTFSGDGHPAGFHPDSANHTSITK